MGGRNPPESVDGLQRNQWTICAGIGGRFAAESVVDLRRNTQKEQDKEIHYTGFPGKPGRYDYERTEDGVVVTDRESGETQLAEEYKPGRYRFRVDGKWRYITDKDIDTAECRRRTQDPSTLNHSDPPPLKKMDPSEFPQTPTV